MGDVQHHGTNLIERRWVVREAARLVGELVELVFAAFRPGRISSPNSPTAKITVSRCSACFSTCSRVTRLALSMPSVITSSTLRSRVPCSPTYVCARSIASRIAVPPMESTRAMPASSTPTSLVSGTST